MNSHRFLISGKVKCVWYSSIVQRNAQHLGFDGFVRELPDGRVEAGVTCEDERLALFIRVLEKGSLMSHVDDIRQYRSDESYTGGFVIHRDRREQFRPLT